MTQKAPEWSATESASPVRNALQDWEPAWQNDDRHLLFHCHRLAMDFGIQAALRALELNASAAKKSA